MVSHLQRGEGGTNDQSRKIADNHVIIDSVRLRLWLLSNGLRFEAAISVPIGLMSANAVRTNHIVL